MAGQKHERTEEHKKAHDMAEKAVDTAMRGDVDEARDLVDQARKIDPRIGDEMGREIDDDRRQSEQFKGGR